MRILINSGLVIPVFCKRDKLIKSIQAQGHEVTIGGYEIQGEKVCREYGVGFTYVPISRAGLNPIADIRTLVTYYKDIKKNKYDIVHGYTAKPNIYGSIAAKLAGVKGIYPTVNGLGYAFTGNSAKNKIVRVVISFLYKIAFACSTKVFFQNKDDAEEMIQRRIVKREKCVIIAGSGIDLECFPYSDTHNDGVFFMATRLLITKGLYQYFEAARVVKKKYPEARFVLAGALDPNPDGIKETELQKYVEDGTIEYAGVVKNMQSALKECSVFVLPSFYREGVPHAILEAMSIGRAILTTNAPGCKETVNGKNGFLIEPKNSEELAEKMLWMMEHPGEVRKMGKESYNYAVEKFDVEIVNSVMMNTMELM